MRFWASFFFPKGTWEVLYLSSGKRRFELLAFVINQILSLNNFTLVFSFKCGHSPANCAPHVSRPWNSDPHAAQVPKEIPILAQVRESKKEFTIRSPSEKKKIVKCRIRSIVGLVYLHTHHRTIKAPISLDMATPPLSQDAARCQMKASPLSTALSSGHVSGWLYHSIWTHTWRCCLGTQPCVYRCRSALVVTTVIVCLHFVYNFGDFLVLKD